MDANEEDHPQVAEEREEPPRMPKPNSSSVFSQQANEAMESAVGEGPQNPEEVSAGGACFDGVEGDMSMLDRGMLMDETLPIDAPLEADESEMQLPGPSDGQNVTKVNGNMLTERLREFIRSPNTWRVIKGLVVIVIAVKLFNSYETFEQYVPTVFGREE